LQKTLSRSPVFYGWFIVAVTFFIALVTVGTRGGFGVFVVPMEEDFGWSRSTISWAATIGFLLNGLSQPFLGRLYDRFGGRKVILVSLAIIGVGTILLSLTFHILFLILIFGVIISIAFSGGSLTTTSALLSRWFQRKRTTALAMSTAGASIGGLILVPFAMYLIQATSWRITWVALGAIVLVLALPVTFFLLKDDPKDMGLRPDGDPEPATDSGSRPASAVRGPLEADSWRASFRTFPIWQLSGAYFVCGFTTAIMSAHFVPYAQDRGFSPSLAATAFGVMSGLNVIGVIVIGALSDKLGSRNLLAFVYVARGCAYATLLLAPGAWGLWGFVVVTGFSWWATAPLTTSLTADVYGLKTLGTLTGVSFLAHQVGGAASIQFAGFMRDVTGEYTIPFAVAAFLLIPAALSAFSIREKKYSRRYQSLAAPTGTLRAEPQG